MYFSCSRDLRRHVAFDCSVLALAVTMTLSLFADQPQATTPQQAPGKTARSTDVPLGEALAANGTGEEADDLSAVLGEMSDRQLLALAQGEKLPAKLQAFENSPRLSAALLKELAERWKRSGGPPNIRLPLSKVPVPATGKQGAASESEPLATVAEPLADVAEPSLTSATVEAISGQPFSIGIVELKFAAGQGPTFHRDQPLFLDSNGQRVHYAAFDVSYQEQAETSTSQVDRLRVLFLISGEQVSAISLKGLEGVEFDAQPIRFIEDSTRHVKLLREWWDIFSVLPQDLDREQKLLKQSLLEMLARRLNLPGPWPSVQAIDSTESSGLESQFERAIGMLFGIESVKLAMQQEVNLNDSWHRERADQPLPARPRLRSLPVPSFPSSTQIEPIAMHVPAECFYLRTGSLANYRYFRRFLMGWGGSLDDIVATRSLDHQTRSKIEVQLGLLSDNVSAPDFDQTISDMALIGCDPFFHDGAAIGVLFHARQPNALLRQIQELRQQVKRQVPEAIEQRVNIGNHAVSLLTSDDNRIRSFYAIDGEYHLVTNSRALLSRFFEAGRGERSLGELKEFRYARSKTQVQFNPLAFLYLSDPFFQNLVSPHYRIELTRRRQAAEELKQFRLARLVAEAEQLDSATVAQLIEKRLLPPHFASRPDKSIPIIKNGKLRDSLRGSPQAFLPVPDVPLDKATRSEVYAYKRFLDRYNQEWNRVDPVTVIFSRHESQRRDHDWVHLDIVVAPYAQNRYAPLRRHLAEPNTDRVAPLAGDLLSLDTSIRTRVGMPSHLLYLGLRDNDVPFAFENGSLQILNQPEHGSYAKSHSYAAISPPSTAVLQLLASFLDAQNKQAVPAATLQRQENAMPPPGVGASVLEKALYDFGWTLGRLSRLPDNILRYLNSVETQEDWAVVANSRNLRKSILPELTKEFVESAPQVRLQMNSLRGAKVEPYIQAHTYLSARKVSSENAKFLNDFSHWMHLPTSDARDTVENLLGARFDCPLGGDFALEVRDGVPRWVGTQWQETSLYTVSETPESWSFPFLDWVQRMNLQFELDSNTLRAKVNLLVHSVSDEAVDGKTVRLQLAAQPEGIAAVNHRANRTVAKLPIADETRLEIPMAIEPPRSSEPKPTLDTASVVLQRASIAGDANDQQDWVLGIRLDASDQWLRVTSVYPDSPASRAGLQIGDKIETVDRTRPRSHAELVRLLRTAFKGDGVAELQVVRDGATQRFRIPLLAR